MKKFACIVCGAGMAGFAAALAARRAGASVLLLDKLPSAGGTAVYAITAFLSGWPRPQKAGGIADELLKNLEARGGVVWRNNAAFDEDIMQWTMLDMLHESGVETLFNATVCKVDTCDRKVKSVTVMCGAEEFTFAADNFVDATGDASFSVLAGAGTVTPPVEMSMTKTVMFKVRKVKNFDKLTFGERFQEKLKTEKFPVAIQDRFMGTPLTCDDELAINLTAAVGDAADPVQYNAMYEELLRQIPGIVEYLKKNFTEFEDCCISKIAPVMGVRYTRSIVGRRQLTLEDMHNPEPPPEVVALCGNYYGGHYINGFTSPWGSRMTGNPAIPYGALRSASFDNLLAAGRIIDVDPRVVSAIRLNVTCMLSGQAAGIAAALNIPPYEKLRAELLKQNCLLEK